MTPRPHGKFRTWCLTFAILMTCPVIGSAILPADSVDFVIVTTSELAPQFETLASFKTDIGLSARVVTLTWINANVAPGLDQAATIRNFLQEAYSQWGTDYVMLGGTIDLIPTRWVFNSFYPTVGGTNLPVDLYYAGLDGDWDADGDGVYGEPYDSLANPGDDADLEPELAFGRAPVSTPAEAELFVAKSISFHLQSGSIGLPKALLVADVLFPSQWQPGSFIILDSAEQAESMLTPLQTADPPWLTDRFYENYTEFSGAEEATPATVLDAMSNGEYRLVHHMAFIYGDSLEVGQGYITPTQLHELNNPNPFFFVSLGSFAAKHQDRSAIVRALLAPQGGCAIGLGATGAAFAHSTYDYYDSFYQYALNTPESRLGDALKFAFTQFIGFTESNYVHRWTQMSLVLLGDPTLPFSATQIPVSIDDRDPEAEEHDLPTPSQFARLSASPNPFNPLLEIRVELPSSGQVRVVICDVRGAEIRELFNGTHAAGADNWRWNGQDNAGQAVPSGVYLVRLETSRRIVHRSVTLVR